MQQYAELIHVLNDLIRINTDRIGELKKRINDLGNNSEVVPLFKRLIKESGEFKEQLLHEVQRKGGAAIINVVSNSGKIYDSWKELKNWLLQKKDLSILERVQFDTKAALKVYKEALFVVANIPADTLDLIATQKARLRDACKKIESELMLNQFIRWQDF
jgi:uncharacterized protein (TIGR02284 family)